MNRYCRFPVMFIVLALSVHLPPAAADIIEYRLPGTKEATIVVLQGRTKQAGRSISYMHPKFGRLIMGVGNYKLHKVPTPQEQFGRKFFKAKNAQNTEPLAELVDWCVRYGMTKEVYRVAAAILKLDPQQERALAVKELYRKIRRDLGDSQEEEAYLRKEVPKDGMRIAKSPHYILLHDTDEGVSGKRSRAEERLELLERVYESFLLKFYSRGIQLEVPRRRLMVVLFKDRGDFLAFSSKLGPDMQSVAGFWHSKTNIAVFFDQGESDRFAAVRAAERAYQRAAQEAKRNRKRIANVQEIVRSAEALRMMMRIAREDADIEVVSHEATHQMAGNTGLLPRHVEIPAWIHEGLATYFEAPEDATWSGVGAVNSDRLRRYRQLAEDNEHSHIDFIVGDQVFDFAKSLGATLHGYAQAWALTHFLIEEHFAGYTAFCRRLGEMPPDTRISSEVLQRVFSSCFAETDIEQLNGQWKTYMRGLQTDTAKIIGYEKDL